MRTDAGITTRRRRWTKSVTGAFVAVILVITYSTWRNHRWIDPRFVGAWRVTHNRTDDVEVSILILSRNGSGTHLMHAGTSWFQVSGSSYGWRLGRDGFHFGKNPTFNAQLSDYLGDLGGFRSTGRLQRFRHYFGGMPWELVSVAPDKIVLRFSREGIIKPDELTLARMAPEDVPELNK